MKQDSNLYKILVDVSNVGKDTGIENYVNGLFGAIEKSNHDFDFTFRLPWYKKNLPKGQKCWLQAPLFEKYRLSKKHFDIWYFPFQLFEWKHFDSLHMNNMILTIHDLNFFYEHDNNSAKFRVSLEDIKIKTGKAKKIIAISNHTKKDIIDKLNIEESRIEVIHNGFTIKRFDDFSKPKHLPKKKFIFSLGSRRNKNIHLLPNLLISNNFELILGRLRPYSKYGLEVKQIAKILGVEDRVKILGHITEAEKYWYYKNCDAYCSPSITEGFGLTVLEAMSFGKPVFLSKLTSLPEVGGNSAYYFENFDTKHMQNIFSDGMKHYANDPTKSKKIIDWTKQFSWDYSAQKLLQVFKDVLQKGDN